MRRTDLYALSDLERGQIEFNNRRLERFYYNGPGAWVRPTRASGPTVSQMHRVFRATQRDVDLVEIMEVAHEETFDEKLPWRSQIRGTCVGQGAATAADMVMSVAWLVFNKLIPGRAAVATAYAGSRVEVANRPGSWDGSNGVWVAKWVRDWGVATIQELGLSHGELAADERLGIRWTASRAGVPEKFEKISRERPVANTPQVTTAEELIACMESGNPVIHGSNLIPYDRDTDNVVDVRRAGGHLTVFGGIRWVNGEPQIKYVNSWSRLWGRNGCVWISMRDAVRILSQDDSYAFVGMQGLVPSIPLL